MTVIQAKKRVALVGLGAIGRAIAVALDRGMDGLELVAVSANQPDKHREFLAGLSGGQGKMVALGRALMVGTRAVLLDEPFQGLAPALALRYAEALARLRAALPDVAILITESSPELLRSLVDSTYVIERGEIVPQ